MSAPQQVPSGTVAFLFADIEGFTRKSDANPIGMTAALRRYEALAHAALEPGGYIFKSAADSFFVAFSSVGAAVIAARAFQRSLLAEDWSAVDGLLARIAVHVGAVESRDGDYFGRPLNRLARILGVAHGGQILLSSAAADLAGEALTNGASLRDLGAHRLRDLESAERVFQFSAPELLAEFPRLRSLQTTPNNLPVQLTRFIGRDAEVAELRELFRSSHLLTLLGFGGVGKSRLALQLAAESIDRFPGGVWFVDLSPIVDGDVVAEETARVVGVGSTRERSALAETIEALRDKEALLVFDGCEHVLAPAARVLDGILRACPLVRAIATTREALSIGGETVYAVNTFDLPPATVTSAREAVTYTAVQLFVERSSAASASFAISDDNAQAIAEICRRLDGIALALELAAPKVTVLSPRQLADRLHERFRVLRGGSRTALPRQQTLRALIDWSFDLLVPEERAVFRRLSSFAGTWTLEAASAVCGDDEIDGWRVFEVVARLVEKSLVISEPAGDVQRFHLLDSIRDYGKEKLSLEDDVAAVSGRLVRYYVRFLSDLERFVRANDATSWRAAFELEIENIRGAIEWAVVAGHDLGNGRTLLSLLEWSAPATTPREAVRWFDIASDGTVPFASDVEEARFFRHYARLAWLVGRSPAWREARARVGLDAARRSGDTVAIARAFSHLAGALYDAGRHDEAERAFEESLRERLPLSVEANVLADRAANDLERGELDLARERFARVARLEPSGSLGQGIALLNLAELQFATGDFAAARSSGNAARDVLAPLEAVPLVLLCCNRAAYAMAVDELDEARDCLHEALERASHGGNRWAITALEHHAVFSGLIGAFDRAALLLGFTDAQNRAADRKRKVTERFGFERLSALLASTFSQERLARRFVAGERMTLAEALSLAAEIHVIAPPVTQTPDS